MQPGSNFVVEMDRATQQAQGTEQQFDTAVAEAKARGA
jgi:hypothetical protein